jgi:Na+/proline symporter
VLGAFLVGVLTRGVDERAMLSGMIAGVVVLAVVWWTGAVAWTWYALLGASVTAAVALVIPRRGVPVRLPSAASP